MSPEVVRIALVGLGNGALWGRELAAQPNWELTLVDTDAAALHALGDELGVPPTRRYTDYEEMLRRAEVAFIILVTPTPLHLPMSLAGLETGRHVICEKPLAMSLDEAGTFRRAVRHYDKRFMVAEQYRFADGCRNLRRALNSGAVGQLAYIAHEFYRGSRPLDRGAGHWSTAYAEATLHDMAVHHFDMWWYLTGQPCEEIYARAFDAPWNETPRKIGYSIVASLADGTQVDYFAGRALARPQTTWYGKLWLVGEAGALSWEGETAAVTLTRALPGDNPRDQDLATETLTWETEPTKPRTRMLREFFGAIDRGEPHPCTIDDNLPSFVTSQAAIESAAIGRPVAAGEQLRRLLAD